MGVIPLTYIRTERIRESRTAAIQWALNSFHNLHKSLLVAHCCKPTDDVMGPFCDDVILGSLCKSMVKITGEMLPKSADDVTQTANEFLVWAEQIIDGVRCVPRHEKCNPVGRLAKELRTARFRGLGITVTPSDELYMKTQSQKTGLAEQMES